MDYWISGVFRYFPLAVFRAVAKTLKGWPHVRTMYTLIGLSDGIYLEASKARLQWGISREQAWRVGNPLRYLADDDTRILWDDKLFGGLPCNLLVYLPDNAVLDRIDVWFNPQGAGLKGDDSLLAAYDYVTAFARLTEYFNAPKTIKPGVMAPRLVWKHDGCVIYLEIATRFEDRMVLTIVNRAEDSA